MSSLSPSITSTPLNNFFGAKEYEFALFIKCS